MPDEMIFTILADGTIKTETTPISPANHQSAEAFMNQVKVLTGGAMTRQRKGNAAHHGHTHTHVHTKE